jgi:hypothetical protein
MPLTKEDIKTIVDAAFASVKGQVDSALASVKGEVAAVNTRIEGLEKLFLEKLNGHGGNVERLSDDVDKLGTAQRKTESDLVALRERVIELEGVVKTNAAVAVVADVATEKKDAAIATVKSGITAMHVVWISVGSTLVGAVLSSIVAWLLTGGGHS